MTMIFKSVRLSLLSAVALLIGSIAALAEQDWLKESTLESEAQVRAVVSLCDRIAMSEQSILDSLESIGIPVDEDDEKWVEKRAQELVRRFERYDRSALCLAGEIMWGPEGIVFSNKVTLH